MLHCAIVCCIIGVLPIINTQTHGARIMDLSAFEDAERFFRENLSYIAAGSAEHLAELADRPDMELTAEQLQANAKAILARDEDTDIFDIPEHRRYTQFGTLSPGQMISIVNHFATDKELVLEKLLEVTARLEYAQREVTRLTDERDELLSYAYEVAHISGTNLAKVLGTTTQYVYAVNKRAKKKKAVKKKKK